MLDNLAFNLRQNNLRTFGAAWKANPSIVYNILHDSALLLSSFLPSFLPPMCHRYHKRGEASGTLDVFGFSFLFFLIYMRRDLADFRRSISGWNRRTVAE